MGGPAIGYAVEGTMKLGLLLTALTLLAASATYHAPANSALLPVLIIVTLALQILAILRFMRTDRDR